MQIQTNIYHIIRTNCRQTLPLSLYIRWFLLVFFHPLWSICDLFLSMFKYCLINSYCSEMFVLNGFIYFLFASRSGLIPTASFSWAVTYFFNRVCSWSFNLSVFLARSFTCSFCRFFSSSLIVPMSAVSWWQIQHVVCHHTFWGHL